MLRIPLEEFPPIHYNDQDVIRSWKWFMSLFDDKDWQIRRAKIEERITVKPTKGPPRPLNEGTLLVINDDQIGWYLYLVELLIYEPHKYEYYQGARIVPIFKRLGEDFDLLMNIEGIKRKVKTLIKKRKSEADAILFEILTALLWARNGWEVSFLEESKTGKMPDLFAKKDGKEFYIECKRQKKTSDYTYRETQKRQRMASHISQDLIQRNMLLEIVFHVELETLPDTYLRDLLLKKLPLIKATTTISEKGIVDVKISFIDVQNINRYLDKQWVKNPSPQLTHLIAGKPVDNLSFTSGMAIRPFLLGEGETNNQYVHSIGAAYGIFWYCDAPEAINAKARDIKMQLHSALQQFQKGQNIVIQIGIETFDGPEVELQRSLKISETLNGLEKGDKNLQWIYCHFFQSYSPPDRIWMFDETVNTISSSNQHEQNPLSSVFLVMPDNIDSENLAHWQRPLP